jgi:hypothetical protein
VKKQQEKEAAEALAGKVLFLSVRVYGKSLSTHFASLLLSHRG